MARRIWPFATMNLLLTVNIIAALLGGAWLLVGFPTALVASTLIDQLAGDETRSGMGEDAKPWLGFLDAMLYLTLPLMLALSILVAHHFGTADPVGLVAALKAVGVDLDAARTAASPLHLAGAVLALGLMTGAAATNVAHELIHRLDNPWALSIGRWLLAFSFDTTFAIEHVHGHHRHVGTLRDPATARRGEYVLAFAVRSTVDGSISAWRIEQERLARKGLALWSTHNRVLTGQAMSLALALGWLIIAGGAGVAAFIAIAVQGKLYLELVNYIEHYGLVRLPGSPVEPRHSWNSYRRMTNGLLYNLARHSHHHRFAQKPYWQLDRDPGAPTLPYGYMTMVLASLLPPVWSRLMAPRLAEWDRAYASPGERAWLEQRGLLQGGPDLTESS